MRDDLEEAGGNAGRQFEGKKTHMHRLSLNGQNAVDLHCRRAIRGLIEAGVEELAVLLAFAELLVGS